MRADAPIGDADPYGLDLQLALYVCYELHYRGLRRCRPRLGMESRLLQLRAQLERAFLAAVRRDVGDSNPTPRRAAEMDALSIEPIDGDGPVILPARQGHLGADA